MTLPLDIQSGDLVWARLKGYPWWPAVVAECTVRKPANLQGKWKTVDPKDGQYKIWCSFYNESSGAWIKPKSIVPYSPDTVDELMPKKTHKSYLEIKKALELLQHDWKMFDSMGLVVDNRILRKENEEGAETEDEFPEAPPPPPLKKKRGRASSTGERGSAKKRKISKAKTPKTSRPSTSRRKKSSILGKPTAGDTEMDLGMDEDDDSDVAGVHISAEDEEELYAVTQGRGSGKRGKRGAATSTAKVKELKDALLAKTEELDAKDAELRKKSDDVDRWKKKCNAARRDLRDLKNGASAIVIPAVPAELEAGSPVGSTSLFKKSISESMLASMVGGMELKVKKFAQQGKEADQLRQQLMNSVRSIKSLSEQVRDAEQAAVELEKKLGISLKDLLEYKVSVEMLHATRAGRTVREVRKKLKHSRFITSYGDQLVNEWMKLVKNAQNAANKEKSAAGKQGASRDKNRPEKSAKRVDDQRKKTKATDTDVVMKEPKEEGVEKAGKNVEDETGGDLDKKKEDNESGPKLKSGEKAELEGAASDRSKVTDKGGKIKDKDENSEDDGATNGESKEKNSDEKEATEPEKSISKVEGEDGASKEDDANIKKEGDTSAEKEAKNLEKEDKVEKNSASTEKEGASAEEKALEFNKDSASNEEQDGTVDVEKSGDVGKKNVEQDGHEKIHVDKGSETINGEANAPEQKVNGTAASKSGNPVKTAE